MADKEKGLSSSQALAKYCAVDSLDVEDVKFCYNIDSFKRDIYRLVDLGANNERICKKVKAINEDFCRIKQTNVIKQEVSYTTTATGTPSSNNSNDSPPLRTKRGVIYI